MFLEFRNTTKQKGASTGLVTATCKCGKTTSGPVVRPSLRYGQGTQKPQRQPVKFKATTGEAKLTLKNMQQQIGEGTAKKNEPAHNRTIIKHKSCKPTTEKSTGH